MYSQPVHKILLVDDDPGVRHSLELLLNWAGYRVSTAEHSVDAILVLQRAVPDVIIYELELNRVPGHDFLAIVRQQHPQISVIGMSNHDEDGAVPEGVLADAVYVKGLTRPESLLKMAAELIRTAGAREAERQKAVHPPLSNGRASRAGA